MGVSCPLGQRILWSVSGRRKPSLLHFFCLSEHHSHLPSILTQHPQRWCKVERPEPSLCSFSCMGKGGMELAELQPNTLNSGAALETALGDLIVWGDVCAKADEGPLGLGIFYVSPLRPVSYPQFCSSMRMVLEDAGGLCISSELRETVSWTPKESSVGHFCWSDAP